jgi:hypothetical protein
LAIKLKISTLPPYGTTPINRGGVVECTDPKKLLPIRGEGSVKQRSLTSIFPLFIGGEFVGSN